MTPKAVRRQLGEVFDRLIGTNLSVKQFYPSEKTLRGGGVSIGSLALGAISLRDISYDDVYKDIESSDAYHIKLPDGGLLIFQYVFNKVGELEKHRLCYFPCFALPAIDEAPELYENDELYGDVVLKRLVRFPIRFDYDPKSHLDVDHPICHLTLGQYENCRIPVEGAVGPNAFVMFLLRNFYGRSYRKNKNALNRKAHFIPVTQSLTSAERRIAHFMTGC
jgi:hypothetical protein